MGKLYKKEAIEYLGISERAIERYVKSGKLKAHYEASKTGKRLVVMQEDADAFKAEMEAPQPIEPQPPQSTALARLPNLDGTLNRGVDGPMAIVPVSFLESTVRKRQGGLTVGIEHKFMLSIDEAVALSGIGKSALNAAIRAGKLAAHKGYGRGRRIKRSDLEKLVSKL